MTTKPRLLLVDDEELNRDMLSRRLARHGYDVVVVANGPDTLAAVEREPFALLLVDVMMPDMSGLEVLRRLRQTRTPDQLPIIMVTARAQSEDIVEALDLGANDYVTKPVDMAVMLARIRTQLARRDAEQTLRASHDRLWQAVERARVADALTGIPNRMMFTDRIGRLIDHGRRVPGFGFAVLVLDLDRFKSVNDSLGYPAGDELIVEAAARLEQVICQAAQPRLADDAVARLGGDEFAVLVGGVKHPSDATSAAARVLAAFAEPFEVAGQTVFATVSIGIALSATGYEQAEDMLRDADIALGRAKEAGRACAELFDVGMREQVLARVQLETDLRWALGRGELALEYQPIVALADHSLTGVEALVRWRHPQRGMLMPADFLWLAEETGLIVPIGYWVVREACRQLDEWSQERGPLSQITVAVNLSSRHLLVPDLAARLAAIAGEYDVEPSRLEIELSERAAMANVDATRTAFKALKAAGFRLTIDDFGSGYSSLSSLQRFPVDRLKIDRAFLRETAAPAEYDGVIRGMIDLVGRLDMEIVAGGIEHRGQLEQLAAMRCTYGQGYLIGRPGTADLVAQLIGPSQGT